MSTTVALLNMKGGVGKTTLAYNLAWYCVLRHDQWVLVVDLDPQFNISQYLMGQSRYHRLVVDEGHPTVAQIFERRRSGLRHQDQDERSPIVPIQRYRSGGLDLIPSHLEFAHTLRNSASKERLLANFLQREAKRYDLILIDCPPTESMATDAAYWASDLVLVPVKPEFLAAIGLPLLANSLAEFREKNPEHEVEIAGIVFNDVVGSTENYRSKDDVAALAKKQRWNLFKSEVSHSDSYPKGARMQSPIMRTDYARWTKVNEFDRFGGEFMSRLKKASKSRESA